VKHEKIVIIGTGPAGWTAAVYASRAELKPLVIAGEMPGGLLTQTSEVENFPGFAEGINGFDLMLQMQQQAERFGARIEYDVVESIKLAADGKPELRLAGGETIVCEALIVATGASPRYLGLPAEEKFKNHGVSACATCDGAFFKEMPVVVVGGGDSAAEEATFLTRFASKVYLVHRRHELRASKIMAERVLANPKIEMVWDSAVEDILGGDEVEKVRVKNLIGGEVREIAAKGYFAALGHVPNTALFKDLLELDDAGYIKLDGASSRTNVERIFAAGDCADHVYRQAITAAGMGCRAAIDAERFLAGSE
jgi:thioredoxin reductase (NADPH)